MAESRNAEGDAEVLGVAPLSRGLRDGCGMRGRAAEAGAVLLHAPPTKARPCARRRPRGICRGQWRDTLGTQRLADVIGVTRFMAVGS